jgi:hypothetical protein
MIMTRTVYALWHGGSSYSQGELDQDLEVFDSITAAKAEFETRYRSGRYNTFTYADGRSNRDDTPAVDESASMFVYLADPRGDSDPYPDRLIEIGPRGGVKVTRA